MNANDFVVLPNNKARSVKLNVRNLKVLQKETLTLAQESREMEERLQQLKERMKQEKEERGRIKWKSGQCGSSSCSALTYTAMKNKNSLQKHLSAGKVKIRVLKDETLMVPPVPPPPPPTIDPPTTRKNRMRGHISGHCEVKTAEPANMQTHEKVPNDIICLHKQMNTSWNTNPEPNPAFKPSPEDANTIKTRGEQNTVTGPENMMKHASLHHDSKEILAVSHREETKVDIIEGERKENDFPTSLLEGEYQEEESANSFQEAVRQWRRQRRDGAHGHMTEDRMWAPVQPVSVSAMATQADLLPDRGTEGRGRGGKVPVRVEFMESSLTYMDRLLLKKHHRTPVESCHSLLATGPLLKSQCDTKAEEETTSSLTAEEEEFRHYCASLFAGPVGSSRTEPLFTRPKLHLIIEVLDEVDRDITGVSVVEPRTDNIKMIPCVQQVSSKERAHISSWSPGVSCTDPSPGQPSRESRESEQPETPRTPQTSHRSLSSKSKPSAHSSAETPRTSKTSIKTSASKSQKPSRSPSVHKSKPECRSSQSLSSPSLPLPLPDIPKLSHSALSFPPDVSPLMSTKFPEERLSPSPPPFCLGSTFIVSPSSFAESSLLPKIYQSTPLHEGSASPVLPGEFQSSQLFPEPVSSLTLSHSATRHLESSPKLFPHSLCDPESLLSDDQLQSPSSLNPAPECLQLSSSCSSQVNEYPLDSSFSCTSSVTCENAPVFTSSTPVAADNELAPSHQDMQSVLSLPANLLNTFQNLLLADKMEVEEELTTESEDEMSTDSLGEENSFYKEPEKPECLARQRSRGDRGDSVPTHVFVPVDAEKEEPDQVSESITVMHRQTDESLSFDTNSDLLDGPHCDQLHTRQSPLMHDSHQTGSQSHRSGTDDKLVFRVTDNHTLQTGIRIHSSTPTRRGETLANQSGTSSLGSNLSHESTPTLSCPSSMNTTPRSASSQSQSHYPTHSTLDQELGGELRPLSRATLEIMEICGVDQTDCQDPDLDTETTAHTLHDLEEELRLMAKETGPQILVVAMGDSRSPDHRGNDHRVRVSEEPTEEDQAAHADRQSVLLLP